MAFLALPNAAEEQIAKIFGSKVSNCSFSRATSTPLTLALVCFSAGWVARVVSTSTSPTLLLAMCVCSRALVQTWG